MLKCWVSVLSKGKSKVLRERRGGGWGAGVGEGGGGGGGEGEARLWGSFDILLLNLIILYYVPVPPYNVSCHVLFFCFFIFLF